jgi:hypothetical protein
MTDKPLRQPTDQECYAFGCLAFNALASAGYHITRPRRGGVTNLGRSLLLAADLVARQRAAPPAP